MTITAYNNRLGRIDKATCVLLMKTVNANLKGAEAKVWHGSPVWFLDGNPIVSYAKRKVGVTLMFFSGQSFKEPGLKKEGSFKAAEKNYTDKSEVKVADLRRWLKKSKSIQWDYKNIVKRKGKLVRIKR